MINFLFDLRLFDGAATDGESSGDTSTEQINGTSAIDDNGEVIDPKQTDIDYDSKFEEMIKGEYKNAFTKRTQDIINRRFKQSKENEAKLAEYEDTVKPLLTKYGVSDLSGLKSAIESDDSMWEEAAYNEGMTVDQYKEMTNLRIQNERYQQNEQQRIIQEQTNAKVAEWRKQAENIKAYYPDFDLDSEVANNLEFKRFIQSGIPADHAYFVMHMDDVMHQQSNASAAVAEKKVLDNIRAKGSRPSENGISAQNPVKSSIDVSKLTPQERKEFAKKAQMGETISFRK